MTQSVGAGSYTGFNMAAGETLAFGDVVYVKSDGKLWKADSTDATKQPAVGVITVGGAANASVTMLQLGTIKDTTWTWTVGGIVYLGAAGALTQTAGYQRLGVARSATTILVGTNASGGSQPWVEHDLAGDVADWDADSAGTWSSVGGVISQTNATGNSVLQYDDDLPSTQWVMEADIRIPSGQDAGVAAVALICAGQYAVVSEGVGGTGNMTGPAAALVSEAAGDGHTIDATVWTGGSEVLGVPTAITQNTWHTLKLFGSTGHQVVYVDGVLVTSSAQSVIGAIPDASAPPDTYTTDWVFLGAVGLVDFRNVRVWTQALPA